MNKRGAHIPILTLATVTLLVLAACSQPSYETPPNTMMTGPRNAPGAGPGQNTSVPSVGSGSYDSLGEQIWVTGVGSDGRQIAFSAPRQSQGALMMGSGGCASCHGQDGRGGTIRMMMGAAIKAPDVTYSNLAKDGYTEQTIGRAITQGLDEAGKPLEQAMPRWQMNATDLSATIAYLRVLGQK